MAGETRLPFSGPPVHGTADFPRFRICGDMALSVELGEGIDTAVNRRVHALFRTLKRRGLPGILSLNPTYRSLFVQYDPTLCSFERLITAVEEALGGLEDSSQASQSVLDIPVCYGDEFGPDLAEVAAYHGLSPEEVIRRHTAPVYHVYMIGFTPGFPTWEAWIRHFLHRARPCHGPRSPRVAWASRSARPVSTPSRVPAAGKSSAEPP